MYCKQSYLHSQPVSNRETIYSSLKTDLLHEQASALSINFQIPKWFTFFFFLQWTLSPGCALYSPRTWVSLAEQLVCLPTQCVAKLSVTALSKSDNCGGGGNTLEWRRLWRRGWFGANIRLREGGRFRGGEISTMNYVQMSVKQQSESRG